MNLPWDKSYFKICFYIIFTFICIYLAKNIIDGAIYTFINIDYIFSLFVFVFKNICSIFSIIIAGFIMAFILRPLIIFISKKVNCKRRVAVSIVFVFILFCVFIFSFTIIYKIDFREMADKIEIYYNKIIEIYKKINVFLEENDLFFVKNIFNNLKDFFLGYGKTLCLNVFSTSKYLVEKVITFILSVVVAFYILKDEKEIRKNLKKYTSLFIKEKYFIRIENLFKDIYYVFSCYLKGQLLDGLIMSILLSGGLYFLKIPFGVYIGIFSGFANIVPYFGSIVGFLLACFFALLSDNPSRVIYVSIYIVFLQQLDTLFIVPKIIGDNVKLSPLVIIISLAIAGKLFGIIGMVFVVPLVAVVKLRLDRYVENKKMSKNEKKSWQCN